MKQTDNHNLTKRSKWLDIFTLGKNIEKFCTPRHATCRTLVFLFSLTVFISVNSFGQIQSPTTPTFGGQTPVNPHQSYTPRQYSNGNNGQTVVQQQNRQAMQRMGFQPPPTEADVQANLRQQRQANYQQQISKQEKQRRQIYTILTEESKSRSYSFSNSKRTYNGLFRFADVNSTNYKNGISYYETAFSEISEMLDSNKPIDLKKAVFLAENAFIHDEVPYADFVAKIEHLKSLLNQIAEQEKLNLNNSIASHYAIQKLYTDTIFDRSTNATFYPFKYDFEDIFGENNYAQTFVSKLLFSGKGQCKSMPLLYSILANELNAESYLSFSPNHSYIKYKDNLGTWYNYETTNGMSTTDGWVIGSGFVKSEAIRSKTFTEPIGTEQILAHLLVELAMTYQQQFGYDQNFMDRSINKALEHFPNDIFGLMVKANMKMAEFDRSNWEANYPNMEDLSKYPKQNELFNQMLDLFAQVEETGYTEMPKQAYQDWLNSLEDEKQKIENEKFKLKIKLKALD